MIDKSLSEHYYAPFRVRGMLRNWQTLLDNPPRNQDEPKRYQKDNEWRLVRRIVVKADMESAMAVLHLDDPQAADAIDLYYMQGVPVDGVADALTLSERAVYYRIQRGIKRMLIFLGCKPLDEDPEQECERRQSAILSA
jgi:DNA-directed RNA polymerase specialized sigma24 family protein